MPLNFLKMLNKGQAGFEPVPRTDAEAAPLLHAGDVLLGLLHLGVHRLHVVLDAVQLLWLTQGFNQLA